MSEVSPSFGISLLFYHLSSSCLPPVSSLTEGVGLRGMICQVAGI